MTNRDNTFRVVAIVGLIVGVMGLSLGFAAFSNSLTITSAADVTPGSDTLNIAFSTSNSSIVSGSVTPTATGATAANATISGTTISGLNAHFTAPGQTVTYSFNVYNASAYTAFLNSVAFENVSGESSPKVCTAKTGTTQSYVDSACNGISISVQVGSTTYTESAATVNSHSLAATTGEAVTVTITYAAGSAEADGAFDVAFGDITLGYSTVD